MILLIMIFTACFGDKEKDSAADTAVAKDTAQEVVDSGSDSDSAAE